MFINDKLAHLEIQPLCWNFILLFFRVIIWTTLAATLCCVGKFQQFFNPFLLTISVCKYRFEMKWSNLTSKCLGQAPTKERKSYHHPMFLQYEEKKPVLLTQNHWYHTLSSFLSYDNSAIARPGRECRSDGSREPSCVCRAKCPDHWKPVSCFGIIFNYDPLN